MSENETDVSDKNAEPENIASETPQLDSLIPVLLEAYGEQGSEEGKSHFNSRLSEFILHIAKECNVDALYNIIILYDSTQMVKSDADSIYTALLHYKEPLPLLLVLYSNGGSAGSAYLIGKLCREHSKGPFVISVPRMAKSAATLLCCAADQIHMGSLSELGPIDPQINGLPALGLKNAIEHIAQLVPNPAFKALMGHRAFHNG